MENSIPDSPPQLMLMSAGLVQFSSYCAVCPVRALTFLVNFSDDGWSQELFARISELGAFSQPSCRRDLAQICSLSRTRYFSWHVVGKKVLATWVHDRSSSKACPEMLSSLDFCRVRRDTWEHLVSTRVRTYGCVCPRSDVEP
jgi:hypothetical protein